MILDEPTNHLDMETREALVAALDEYAGAVVLVSHDWHLVELVADRLWLVEDGTVRPFDGDLEAYRRRLLSRRGGRARSGNGAQRRVELPAIRAAPARREAAERRVALEPLRRKARQAEADRRRGLPPSSRRSTASWRRPGAFGGNGAALADGAEAARRAGAADRRGGSRMVRGRERDRTNDAGLSQAERFAALADRGKSRADARAAKGRSARPTAPFDSRVRRQFIQY